MNTTVHKCSYIICKHVYKCVSEITFIRIFLIQFVYIEQKIWFDQKL